MMKIFRIPLAAAVAAAATLAGSTQLSAQTAERLSLEGRIGVTFPTGDLTDADLGSGLALGLEGMYNFSPALTAYAGLSRSAFSCDDADECGDGANALGFQGGLKLLLVREGRALPWVRGGLLVQKMDTDDDDSGLGLGFEVGGGLDIDLSHRFAIVPALHYRSFSADFEEADVTASWLALTVGAHVHF